MSSRAGRRVTFRHRRLHLDLPTLMVAAFRATLEEVVEADLILHVRDISHPETAAQQRDVETVLGDLHASSGAPLEVWNKADRLSASARSEARHAIARRQLRPVLVSALTGEGLDRFGGYEPASVPATRPQVQFPARRPFLICLHANSEVLRLTTPHRCRYPKSASGRRPGSAGEELKRPCGA